MHLPLSLPVGHADCIQIHRVLLGTCLQGSAMSRSGSLGQ
jgi:hypothetical protein